MLIELLAFGAALLWAYQNQNEDLSSEKALSGARWMDPAGRGEEGEKLVSADLQRHLARVCGDDWLIFNGLILVHAPDSAFPTVEIDHLAITPFGIFVIETKHWGGAVTRGETDATLILSTPDGQRHVRTSPMKQNGPKVRFLKSLIPPRLWLVEGLGVFSNDATTLAPMLPTALLERGELYRHLRIRQQQFSRTGIALLPVQKIADAVLRHADTRAEAFAEHRQRIRDSRAAEHE
jgi:hypothetical protein